MPKLRDILAAFAELTNPYRLGIQLDIDSATLKAIERDHWGDVDRQKTEVIEYWLRNSLDPSWTTLAKAVERMGGHARLVRTLREKEQNSEQTLRSHTEISRGGPFQRSSDHRVDTDHGYTRRRIAESDGEINSLGSEQGIPVKTNYYPAALGVFAVMVVVVAVIYMMYPMHQGITMPLKDETGKTSGLNPSSEDNHRMSITDQPTMSALLSFPASSGKRINVITNIMEYYDFSIQLLQDDDGSILHNIQAGFGPRPENILKEVFRMWLSGSGRPNKTWQTIIQCLKDVRMITLADKLEVELTKN